MKFKPNYVTPDGVFDVDIDMEDLVYEKGSTNVYHNCKDITDNAIQVYNNNTDITSYKSLYLRGNRLWFKGSLGRGRGTRTYYIDELIKKEEE